MIDYFFKFNTQADAKASALLLAEKHGIEISPGVIEWARDHVLPDVRVWRPSQDTVVDDHTVHQYLTGWYAIVSLDEQRQTLLNAAALAFAMNRDGPPYVIKNNVGAVITDVACEPIFAGSHYPIGGYS